MNNETWNNQVNSMLNDLSTKELIEEHKELRSRINRDFNAADLFKESGPQKFVEPRRQSAIANTHRAKRIFAILEKRKNKDKE